MYTLEFSTNEKIMDKYGVQPGYSLIRDSIIRQERILKLKQRDGKYTFRDVHAKHKLTIEPKFVRQKSFFLFIETEKHFYIFQKKPI